MKKTWRPNVWQRAVLRVYGDGDYRYIVDGTPERTDDGVFSPAEAPKKFVDAEEFDTWCEVHFQGDTLLLWLMRELIDDPFTADEAVRRMRQAIEEIEQVIVPLSMTQP